MILLFETPASFALFKVLDEGKLSNVEDMGKEFSSPDSTRKMVKLKAFNKFDNTSEVFETVAKLLGELQAKVCVNKFDNTSEALEAVAKVLEGTPSKGPRKFLKANCKGEALVVADSKFGNVIKEKLKIVCVHNNAVMELLRGVRSQFTELIFVCMHDRPAAREEVEISALNVIGREINQKEAVNGKDRRLSLELAKRQFFERVSKFFTVLSS